MTAYGQVACRRPEDGILIEVCAWMTVGIESYPNRSLNLPSLNRSL